MTRLHVNVSQSMTSSRMLDVGNVRDALEGINDDEDDASRSSATGLASGLRFLRRFVDVHFTSTAPCVSLSP